MTSALADGFSYFYSKALAAFFNKLNVAKARYIHPLPSAEANGNLEKISYAVSAMLDLMLNHKRSSEKLEYIVQNDHRSELISDHLVSLR